MSEEEDVNHAMLYLYLVKVFFDLIISLVTIIRIELRVLRVVFGLGIIFM